MSYHYLKIRHREKHEGRPFVVYQTLTKPTRYVARWDRADGEDNTPATDADYTATSFCQAIDALTQVPMRQPAPPAELVTEPTPAPNRPLQLDLF